jgi:hypothetical protein
MIHDLLELTTMRFNNTAESEKEGFKRGMQPFLRDRGPLFVQFSFDEYYRFYSLKWATPKSRAVSEKSSARFTHLF